VATSKTVNLANLPSSIFFAGHAVESVYWTTIGGDLLVLDKDAAELNMYFILKVAR
jgi:hypothetical protein